MTPTFPPLPLPPRVVIDPSAIAGLRELNPGDNDEFLREITAIFLKDTPARLADLDRSLGQEDVAAFSRSAHSIKGSSANLGALGVRSAAERLEHHARTYGLAEAGPLLEKLKVEFIDARAALAAIVAPARG